MTALTFFRPANMTTLVQKTFTQGTYLFCGTVSSLAV